ncbi:MAG: transcriptional regulator [Gemmatimonadetes bacterium]|nr:transcriptional regulator [Gemmatimonadota bacterium]
MSARKSRHLAEKVIPRPQLAEEIARLIGRRELAQVRAAEIVNDSPSQLSLLLNGQIAGFSAERLIRMLTLLGVDVDVVLRERTDATPGQVRIRRR